tara:strand:+ start:1268 stop:1525 length:258 start_codon:yes stop_codon:yes gene_type:complete
MTERELILLGFKSEEMREHEDDETYYYVLDIVDGITFITQTNDEIKDDEWYIEFFNTDPSVRFHDFKEVQSLMNQLRNAIVKNEI